MANVDVVVVGAGPAGSATAISLAERGRRVLLVDKATFPRDKVCGDFVSPRSLAVLAALGCWGCPATGPTPGLRRSMVHLNGELISSGPVPQVGHLPGFGLVVPRAVADEILFRRAAAAGAEIVEGFTATGLDVHAERITVHGRRADGPLDARRTAGHRRGRGPVTAGRGSGRLPVSGQRDPFALRAYYRDVPSAPDTTAIFFDADFFPGYAWVFPTGDGGANVGMGMLMDVCPALRDQPAGAVPPLAARRSRRCGTCSAAPRRHGRIVGWPLTGYQGDHGNYADRVLIVGDAGRFIDPLNGEGIHTALESGSSGRRPSPTRR